MKTEHSDNIHLNKTSNQKAFILEELKNRGCRITKQRSLIIDIILSDKFSSCKEIYSEVNKRDSSIGIATVYRMINSLEDIGAIDRSNLYRLFYGEMG